eukprot:SAG11_NODE_26874_length_339_cov_6.095833_1_plen_47_part_10
MHGAVVECIQVICCAKFRRCDCTLCTAVRQMTWTKFKYLVSVSALLN